MHRTTHNNSLINKVKRYYVTNTELKPV